MPLDPDLAAFLELVEANIISGEKPEMHTLTPEKARREYDVSTQFLDVPGIPVGSITTLSIPCRDGQSINARLYKPAQLIETADPLPVLLYFHGGGYCIGGLDSHDSLCRSLAELTPCCVLNVAYRLAPEHRFPTAVYDAQDAYQWVLSAGSDYDLDVTRIAVGGDSAGGTLATGLTIAAHTENWPQPVRQVLLYPCTSVWQNTESHRRFAQGYLLEAKTLQWMFTNYLRTDADRADWRFAPLQASDLGDLAPVFLVLAEYDPLLDEGIAYAEKLRAAGIPTLVKIYSGMTHDFARLGNIVNEADQVRKDIARELANAFYAR
ncbi:alpha/beta hydrolase [Nitrosomonas sp.]|uniref:alpha/beta hydrolase n=1 Tax=Nitrosomonas sp. TaxID=42353 RepID=UPI002730D264|nr:alpha/beta hydrolase [Nitrosomonas sp.]MDP1786273.1 alpha/beta hydrolase [Nitrosomonas sp.]MDP2224445.1 alpha/beta hydrolase [Nitrosomonas sp.]